MSAGYVLVRKNRIIPIIFEHYEGARRYARRMIRKTGSRRQRVDRALDNLIENIDIGELHSSNPAINQNGYAVVKLPSMFAHA